MVTTGSKQLRDRRVAEKTSQDQLAEDWDVRQATISNIETGKHRPSRELRDLAMERYEIEVDAWRTQAERRRLRRNAELREAANE